MKKVEFYLSEYGLNEAEIKSYIGLLKTGPSTILNLSKNIKLNRSTTHVAVDNLIKRGIVSQTNFGEKRIVIAEDPKNLISLLQDEKKEVERKENSFSDMLSSLNDIALNAKDSTASQVKYYEGHKAIAQHYDKVLHSKEIRTYFQPSLILNQGFPENTQKFIDAGLTGELELWDIQPKNSNSESHMNMYSMIPKFHHKFFPEEIVFAAMDYLIYQDHISIVNINEKTGLLSCIVINNKFLYENSKVLFDLIWRLLP